MSNEKCWRTWRTIDQDHLKITSQAQWKQNIKWRENKSSSLFSDLLISRGAGVFNDLWLWSKIFSVWWAQNNHFISKCIKTRRKRRRSVTRKTMMAAMDHPQILIFSTDAPFTSQPGRDHKNPLKPSTFSHTWQKQGKVLLSLWSWTFGGFTRSASLLSLSYWWSTQLAIGFAARPYFKWKTQLRGERLSCS